MRTAVYARYSSALQRPTSLEDQIRLCRDAAPRLNCTVADEHIYTDQELSGTITQRPGYQRLLAAAARGEFESVLVEAQDRLWRDQAEMHHALKRFRFWGIHVFSAATDTDLTGTTGRMLASVLGLKDELYIEDLRQKIRRGMQGQVSRGLSVGGRAYGYRSEPVVSESGQVIGYRRVIVPEEAAVVEKIFRLYAGGMSPKGIARLLNEEGVPAPQTIRGRGQHGWSWTTICGTRQKGLGILRNSIYIGRSVWNRTRKVYNPDTGKRVWRMRPQAEWVTQDAPRLRIIPDDLWARAQAIAEERRRNTKGNFRGQRPKYLFSGLLRCGECGAHFIIQQRGYYGCSAFANKGPAACSNNRLVPRERIERLLLQSIFEELCAPDILARIQRRFAARVAELTGGTRAAQRHRDAELERARAELANIEAAIRQGVVTATTKRMLEDAEAKIARLEAEASRPVASVVPLPSVVEQMLRDLRATLSTDTDAARATLRRLLGEIPLRREGRYLDAELRLNLRGLIPISVVPEEGLEPPRA